jgi:DNA-binding response OmpR family regulator
MFAQADKAKTMARILVIEDQKFITKILEIVVKRDGHTVIAAPTGATGLQLLEQEKPDVVITDIGLPDMSGFDVIRRIKAQHTTPVIVLTGSAGPGGEDYLKTALSLGAGAAFLKPVGADELMNAIRQQLAAAA